MSTNQPKTTKKTYTYFDLNKFEKVSEEREIPEFKPRSADDILNLVATDNDMLVKAVNAYLKRAELRKIKNEVMSKGADTAIVMALAKPFRALPPFSTTYEIGPDGKPKVDDNGAKIIDRKAQTQKIFDFIKKSPELVESIKQATAEAANAEDDEDGENKENED